jgi:AhpD family alkylhydroperoxidase
MARISLIEPAQASPEVKEIYDGKLKGKPGNIQKALAHRPAMLGNFLGFYVSVGRALDRKLYEAVYLRVSLINGCYYCTQHHIQGAKRVGTHAGADEGSEGGQLLGIQRARAGSAPLCRKADAHSRRRQRRRLHRTKKHFSDEQIVDLHHVDWISEPDQPRHRTAGVGSRIP